MAKNVKSTTSARSKKTLTRRVSRFLEKNETKAASSPVQELRVEGYTDLEKSFRLSAFSVTRGEFKSAEWAFKAFPGVATFPSKDDLNKLQELMPEARVDQFATFKTKSVQGKCVCGRNVSVYDIVVASLNTGHHSVRFLEDLLTGRMGRAVIMGSDGKKKHEKKLPKSTFWVGNTSPIPCIKCGRTHDVSLWTPHVLHHWVLSVIP